MRKLLACSAIAFGLALSQQAWACDWMKEANSTPVVVACEGTGCAVDQPADETVIQQGPKDVAAPTTQAPQRAEAPSAPVVVADGGCNGC